MHLLPIGVFDEEMQLVAQPRLEVRGLLLLDLEKRKVRARSQRTRTRTRTRQLTCNVDSSCRPRRSKRSVSAMTLQQRKNIGQFWWRQRDVAPLPLQKNDAPLSSATLLLQSAKLHTPERKRGSLTRSSRRKAAAT